MEEAATRRCSGKEEQGRNSRQTQITLHHRGDARRKERAVQREIWRGRGSWVDVIFFNAWVCRPRSLNVAPNVTNWFIPVKSLSIFFQKS